jgi:hypothetical protein
MPQVATVPLLVSQHGAQYGFRLQYPRYNTEGFIADALVEFFELNHSYPPKKPLTSFFEQRRDHQGKQIVIKDGCSPLGQGNRRTAHDRTQQALLANYLWRA